MTIFEFVSEIASNILGMMQCLLSKVHEESIHMRATSLKVEDINCRVVKSRRSRCMHMFIVYSISKVLAIFAVVVIHYRIICRILVLKGQ